MPATIGVITNPNSKKNWRSKGRSGRLEKMLGKRGVLKRTRSLEELIADTPRGLLVTELIGMGFNPVTGDYSRGAAGLWIEGGEVAHPVEEITIAGNFGDMLRDIDAVANDLLWLGRIASPSLRVARMTVAGAS